MAFEFALTLTDGVTGPGSVMAAALERVRGSFSHAERAAAETAGAVSAVGIAAAQTGAQAASSATGLARAAAGLRLVRAEATSAARALAEVRSQSQHVSVTARTVPSVREYFGGGGGYLGAGGVGGGGRGPLMLPSSSGGSGLALRGGSSLVSGPPPGAIVARARQVIDLPAPTEGPSLFERMHGAMGRGLTSLWEWNKAAGEGLDRWGELASTFSRTPLGLVARGVGSIASSLWDMAKAAASAAFGIGKLTVGAGLLAGGALTKQVLELKAFAEGSRGAFTRLTGSRTQGEAWYQRGLKTSDYLGTDVRETVGQFQDLRAQQFDMATADKLVRFAADMGTISSHGREGAARIMAQITQVKSLGRLRGEELTVMSENGLSSELVYRELEKRMGKDRAGVMKAQQNGGIGADVFVQSVLAAGNAKFHTSTPGQAARQASMSTLGGMWQRLTSMPDRVGLRIAEQVDAGPAKKSMLALSEALEKVQGDQLARFVDGVVSLMPQATSLAIGFFRGFGGGLAGIVKQLQGSKGDLSAWGESAGASLAAFYERVMKGAIWLAKRGPEMWDSFKKGFKLDEFLASLEGDEGLGRFKRLGEGLNTVANALGVILRYTEGIAKVVVGASGFDQYQLEKQREELGPQDWGVRWQRVKDSASGADMKDGYVDPGRALQLARDELMAKRDHILAEQRAKASPPPPLLAPPVVVDVWPGRGQSSQAAAAPGSPTAPAAAVTIAPQITIQGFVGDPKQLSELLTKDLRDSANSGMRQAARGALNGG